MGWIKVLDSARTLHESGVMEVNAGGKTIALVNVNGKICALDGICPHEGGPLAKGSIENGYLVCPWHGWEFDPLTGKDRYNPARGVSSFPVEVRGDEVYVEI
ncbi:MAG: Rieske (2Fe-2S) protein [Prosthecochloris sp.]|uniref:Rieske (2Fe-2S) protein n=1 Tax=Prosthecochloris sp. TaxID=290513 RepID=UPI002583C404|nr:Rieske (2Fe-2S) protein [Prosthecochloris sp.]MCW8798317.1 Rieske (2Fe-2S) protein [Prosthecochloris sp.]